MIKLTKSAFYREDETKQKLWGFLRETPKLSFGEECEKFERVFAHWQGRRECVFLNSGSSANLAIIQALLNLGRLKKGNRVGFSAVTWSTNVMPLIQLGLKPIPVDIELETLNVSSRTLNLALEKHPLEMLFLTNLLGLCHDPDKLTQTCREQGIVLVEDNCEALGSVYQDKKLGNFGLASTFSFYVGHHLSTIEGGAVCTDDPELARMLRIVRAHGWDRNLSLADQEKLRNANRINSSFYSRYTFYDLGFNLRPTEIQGFLGHTQLKHLEEIIDRREKNFLKLAPHLYSRSNKYLALKYQHLDRFSSFAIPLVCADTEIRRRLVAKVTGKVELRPLVAGDITTQPFFQKHVSGDMDFPATPHAKIIHNQGLYFANNPELTGKELQKLRGLFT